MQHGLAFTQSVGHEDVSQEARRSQTMMDQSCVSVNLRILKKKEKTIITFLLSELFEKHVIEKSIHEQGEVISNVFVCPKPDESYRLILNLSYLNDHVEKVNFKIKTLKSALHLVI